jgi:hypothetical protein
MEGDEVSIREENKKTVSSVNACRSPDWHGELLPAAGLPQCVLCSAITGRKGQW